MMKSRMRESRTSGSVRGLHCKVWVYSTICDGQMELYGNVFNEAEELSNLSAAEPTEDSIKKNRRKPENIVAEMNCEMILKRKRSCIRSPKISENVLFVAVHLFLFQKST